MCSLTICEKCGKFSFIGCGLHLKQLFSDKKKEDLCRCNPKVLEFIMKCIKK